MLNFLINISQGLFLILLTPFFIGILKRSKAFVRGYKGAPVFQPYYDIVKLFKKDMVISKSSSFITEYGPSVSLAFALVTSFLVPVFFTSNLINTGNVFMIIFMLSVLKIFNTLIGLDCASTFGGMGSSRESFISLFAEPIMLLTLSFLYFETGKFNLFEISNVNIFNSNFSVSHVLAAISFFILLLAENARMPVDNPETHLELTMVHEAMILDVSGRNLVYLELASSIKLILFITIFLNGFFPIGLTNTLSIYSIIISIVAYLIKLLVAIFIIAILETTIAKFRLFRVPELLAASFSIGLVSIAMIYFKL